VPDQQQPQASTPPQTTVPAWDNLQNLSSNSGGFFSAVGRLLKALFGG
jgi:hypothetical protein